MMLALTTLILASTPAEAGCPGPWATADCEVTSPFGNRDACQYDGATETWTCAYAQTSGTNLYTITVVTELGLMGSATHLAYGNERSGEAFCCTIEPDEDDQVHVIEVIGSNNDDIIRLQGGGKELTESPFDTLEAYVFGKDGDDIIDGSPRDSNAYDEFLDGGDGWDEMRGFAGDDTLRGGRGRDILCGGTGADLLRGELGDDVIHGGGGSDTVLGGGQDGDECNPQGDCAWQYPVLLDCPLD